MNKNVLIILFVISLFLISGCEGVNVSGDIVKDITSEDINKIISCESPYIRHEAGCCLDKDNNKICDEDESSTSGGGSPGCGNNICETNENCASCVVDCGCSSSVAYCDTTQTKPICKPLHPSCYDTDNGDAFKSGTVLGTTSEGVYFERRDYCADSNHLKEYSCNLNNEYGYESWLIYCENGCSNGVCMIGTYVPTPLPIGIY